LFHFFPALDSICVRAAFKPVRGAGKPPEDYMINRRFWRPWTVVGSFAAAGGFIGMDIALWPAAEDFSTFALSLIGGLLVGALAGTLLTWVIGILY
jgi:hypothetical protein